MTMLTCDRTRVRAGWYGSVSAGGRAFIGGALVLVATGCATGSVTPDGHMWQHYQQVGTIRTAVVRGALPDVVDAARWMVDHPSADDLPPGSDRLDAQMRGHAEELAAAASLADAAVATARMARTCGQCHETYGRGPGFPVAEATDDDPSLSAPEMVRHRWASDRMWDGLIGPSDTAWVAGARTLTVASLLPMALRGRNDLHPLEARVHALGQRAVAEATLRGRAEIYGELMATCADCHARIRTGN